MGVRMTRRLHTSYRTEMVHNWTKVRLLEQPCIWGASVTVFLFLHCAIPCYVGSSSFVCWQHVEKHAAHSCWKSGKGKRDRTVGVRSMGAVYNLLYGQYSTKRYIKKRCPIPRTYTALAFCMLKWSSFLCLCVRKCFAVYSESHVKHIYSPTLVLRPFALRLFALTPRSSLHH